MKCLPYNLQITVNQHFVPSHFLSAWCSGDMLWVSNKGFKLFQQKPENVAKSKRLYSSEYMTADEFISCFSGISAIGARINPDLFKIIMDGMVFNLLGKEIISGLLSLDDFNRIVSFIEEKNFCSDLEVSLLRLLWTIYENGHVPDEIKYFCEKQFVEGIEPFATRVEQIGYPLIEKLRCGEASFLDDVEIREAFFLYIALQMFRIRKFTDAAAYYEHINIKTLKLSRILLVARTLDFLMSTWEGVAFCIVNNTTDLEFITGDNPICNLDAHNRSRFLDLYFPISPNKAVFMCNKDRASLYPEMRQMTIQYVHELNRNVAAGCAYQVFAKSKDTLQFGGYRPSFDPKVAALGRE